ncbi:hypothetical protein LSH36_162g02000 [Paralvinella palmiformis]|uniref:J domain-containing protein n=1 Tax=Paralvinella palmiformis TaxID=53620 RepID=A0AAD9JUW2_9ANNE|nr:hypothetical protein LSH36_162g02000 [Paralvinella palmiformis]
MDKLLRCNRILQYTTHLSFHYKRCFHLASPIYKQTHYEVLGVGKDATTQEIRDAFVKRSKEIHPDLNPDDPDTHDKFVLVNEAYNTLSKVKSRREYDDILQQPPTEGYYSGEFYTPPRQPVDEKWSYYGIKGIKRKSNAEVAGLAIAIISVGTFIYLMTGVITYYFRKKHEDRVYKENQAIYDDVRANAGRFKTPEQLENYILQHQEKTAGMIPRPK